MRFEEFRKVGHLPTLLAAFLYFDFSFGVWITFGPLMTYIGRDFGLSLEQKFSLIAIPILWGALLRIPLGAISDTIGSKQAGIAAQLIVIAAVAYAWLHGLGSIVEIQFLGFALGFAGASFAVALPQASRWYPPSHQGLVMGVAGAACIGMVLGSIFVPRLAELYGWRNTFGTLLVPLVIALIVYVSIAKDAPGNRRPPTWSSYSDVLADRDSWWFMFFYAITFGGFVGLANALPLYFTVHYHTSPVAAGMLVAMVLACGAIFRPVGGALADRIGGIRTLTILFCVVVVSYALMSLLPEGLAPEVGSEGLVASGWNLGELPGAAWRAVALFATGTLALGMGNGAVFQLIPLRFRNEIGVVTGLVGAAGGVGGFFLAKALGLSKGLTGGFAMGFLTFSALAGLGLFGLIYVKIRWRTTWGAVSGARV